MALRVVAASQSADDPLSGLRVIDDTEGEAAAAAADPPPQDWVQVTVRAAALNHHDLWSLRGIGLAPDRLPMVLGTDAAGVTADGREVVVHAVIASPGWRGEETLDPARTLLSERYQGTMAATVAVPPGNLVDKPAGLSFAEAACLPTAWLTAYGMLFVRSGLRPGDTVLVQGAGGGVSSAAVVLARAAGMRVWVTSRSGDKRDWVVGIGAHAAFESGARLPDRVDAVIETVGAATWRHSIRSLRPGGTIVVAGATSGDPAPAELSHIFFRQLRVVGSTMGTAAQLQSLTDMLVTTGVHPIVDTIAPVAEAPEAFERLATEGSRGKIVLNFGS